ncbi:MAG: AMP-binding protein, partial [Primorskyibacter sp.]
MLRDPPYDEMTYDQICDGFGWDLPDRLNMACQTCDDWAARFPDRVALVDLSEGTRRDLSYGQLQALSARVQAGLSARGMQPGDRVGVLLSQSPLCAAAHIAIWRAGAISVPLFKLFQRDA